jgi:hypothetical protein
MHVLRRVEELLDQLYGALYRDKKRSKTNSMHLIDGEGGGRERGAGKIAFQISRMLETHSI